MSDQSSGAEQPALPPSEGLRGVQPPPSRPPPSYPGQTPPPPLSQISTSVHGSPAPARGGTPLRLANQTIVGALTKPRGVSAVRTQLFPWTPPDGGAAAAAAPPPPKATPPPTSRKRGRADELPPGCENLSGHRARSMEHKWARSKCIRESYYEHVSECFFLESGGNMLDYIPWSKRAKSQHYARYLNRHQIDPAEGEATEPADAKPIPPSPIAAPITQVAVQSSKPLPFTIKLPNASASSHIPPETVAAVVTISKVPDMIVSQAEPVVSTSAAAPKLVSPPVNKNKGAPPAFPAAQNNQEQIVEKARQEAYVMQRVSELQKEGLWTERRLPKVQEIQRSKSHWDYLLEEMVWLAADFAQERKWKKAAAKKCARMVQKYFQDKALAVQKAEKAQELQLKRIASFIAKEIKTFWSNVEKLVDFKQQTRLEEKRKQALDQHLSFIVDQTEKYSQLLAEGMNKSGAEAPQTADSSRISSPQRSDDEFSPGNQSSEDDEETIAQAEASVDSAKQSEEIAALQRESEMNLEDFLNELPKDYLENREKIVLDVADEKAGEKRDGDFTLDSDKESSDDEDTIMEQEKAEGSVDHRKELDDLQAENEMSIEDLMKKYSNLPPVPDDDKMSVEESSSEAEPDESEPSDLESSSEDERSDAGEDVGLKSLLAEETTDKNKTDGDSDQMINDVAALAESIQPKGNTLSSTDVVTPIPFLLKHTLREYQHIGLDWLVTMYERKLNGILADEMGLGKTIQTIALLAHLACVKGDWGPHLIIVPTSVMLNWEMECKKWCPGFKILTYYGTQKERKLKRTGWTKPNAFHICITSYKLVIQDHQSFRRKKWRYLILDEAQNIKNFKSQRWQLLLNFQTQQRLLLTGTPLQNNLMELWSLMHFLMPRVFQSHREFKEWFSNPVTGMIEGNSEYNESIIKRLHKVLRPFLLRRLKSEVEKQMPQKYEHIIMCRLSKRQRYLYDDYMSRAKTRETLETGNLLSVINVLMQLRKVCNHPNLFEVRPTVCSFMAEGLVYNIPSLLYAALSYDLDRHVSLEYLRLNLLGLEMSMSAYGAYWAYRRKTPNKIITGIDSMPPEPPRCPTGHVRVKVKLGEPLKMTPVKTTYLKGAQTTPKAVKIASNVQQGLKLRVSNAGGSLQGYPVQLIQHQGCVKAIPMTSLSSAVATGSTAGVLKGSEPQRVSVPPGFAQLVNTPLGKHILLTPSSAVTTVSSIAITGTATVVTPSGQRLTVLSKASLTTAPSTPTKSTITNCSAASNTTPTSSVLISSQATTEAPPVVTTSETTTTPVAIARPLTSAFVNQLMANVTVASPVATPNSAVKSEVKKDKSDDSDSEFEADEIGALEEHLERRRKATREKKLRRLAHLNTWRCHTYPMYGIDLREALTVTQPSRTPYVGTYLRLQQLALAERLQTYPSSLVAAVKTPARYVDEMADIFERFVFVVPPVSAPTPSYRVIKPPPSDYWNERRLINGIREFAGPRALLLHPIATRMMTQFPDPRLIQYDCGKLQTLDILLRKLKSESHRVLIFTQMTRMLDVLEAFLNFHGHIYLRLDGTTKVDQRQVLMERFNGDKRIFVFILSTRSGGVGVNLTGADTVIFYDSDWNPTMDAQAQDRCHRIGQTRDVHIYRLISEMTIEENILKKANQKRMLGDLAIEGGNFTTAYFKGSTIQDLFDVNTAEADASARMSETLGKSHVAEAAVPVPAPAASTEDKAALGALENALAACEDDQDVQAARTAKAEAVADLAEFDETIPLEEAADKEPEISKAEMEVRNLINQLTPIERYAMRFVEDVESAWNAEQLAAAEQEIEDQKRVWERNRLASLRLEEEHGREQREEDAEMLTFAREDSTNQIWLSDNTKEQMPMWCPPTPPQQENDVYVDYSMGFLYEMSVMSEAQLPPPYVRKEAKRARDPVVMDVAARRPPKVPRKDDPVYEPRSLFDRPSSELAKMRRELKQQRYRGIARPSVPKSAPTALKIATLTGKPAPEPPCWHGWTVHEDMALLKVIQTFQGLPLNLTIISPGHTTNWDFAADYVNSVSITYRSAKQCRHRYETVLVSREEGKMMYDTSTRKKKTKNIYQKYTQQIKSNRPIRTAQLYTQDNNSTFSQIMIQHYDALKQISNNRAVRANVQPTIPPMKNPKHTAVLTENGIDYENPLMPTEVAARRVEKLREKQKLESPQRATNKAAATSAAASSSGTQSASIASPMATSAQVSNQAQVVTTAIVANPGTPTSGLRTQRIIASPLQTSTVVSVAGLTPAHLAQRLIVTGQAISTPITTAMKTATVAGIVTTQQSAVGATGISANANKTITPAQLQYYRQQALKQQLRLQAAAGLQQQAKAGQASGVQVAGQVQGQAGQQRAQFVKQASVTVANKQGIARTVTDTEMAVLFKRQQQLQQQKALAVAAAASGSSVPPGSVTVQGLTQAQQAQIFAQTGIQVQQASGPAGTQVATLVKAATSVAIPVSGVTLGPQVKATLASGIKTATATPQQIRQLQIHQHLLQKKLAGGPKITQLAQVQGKAGVATQLIVQAAPKMPTAMTVQQLQQVMRQQGPPQLAVSQSGQVVLAKAGPAGRMIPVNAANAQGLKQTIQVVTATSAGGQALATAIRPQMTSGSTLAGALAGTIKVASSSGTAQQQAILSQVSAALQGQPVTVRQTSSPVRIQTASGTPLVAVSVQSAVPQQQPGAQKKQ